MNRGGVADHVQRAANGLVGGADEYAGSDLRDLWRDGDFLTPGIGRDGWIRSAGLKRQAKPFDISPTVD